MKYLFPNFLSDHREFEDSVKHWRSLSERILKEYDLVDQWQPWLDEVSPTGQIENAILVYSIASRDFEKGLIVNQQNPSVHSKWEATAWMKQHDRKSNEDWASSYLVFNCNLTPSTSQIFEELFASWIQPEIKSSDLEVLIDRILPQ